jgi:hypothetical protein
MVRYVVSTVNAHTSVTSRARHVARTVSGSASIKAVARCHARRLVISCLATSDARNSYLVVTNVLASVARFAPLTAARSVA